MPAFNATVDVQIEPVGHQHNLAEMHVLAWLCSDSIPIEGRFAMFYFDVCPAHADPDDCDFSCEVSTATFRAVILAATPESD